MRTPKPILERRRSVRIDAGLPFNIGHEGYEIEARTLNVSTHGAMCALERDIPLMTQLKIGLRVPAMGSARPQEHTLRLKGVVVRKEHDPATKKYNVAVYFPDISEKDQGILKDYIEHR